MAFDNVIFPLIVETVTSSPEFNTTVIPTGSGAEQRNVNWTDGKITFNATLGVRSKQDIQTLINFFRARKGRARGFLVKDLIDCVATETRDIIAIGTAAVNEKTFQLQRVYSDLVVNTHYGITGNADLRPIYKPVRGTIKVYRNSTLQVEGGFGAYATATINSGASGVISGVTITTPGTGYTSVPAVGFSGGGGTGAAGTAVLSSNFVSNTTITNGGTGYTSAPTVAFSGGGGTGAAGTAVLTGTVVSSITITDPGTGYTSAPTIAFSGGGGSGAAATAVIGAKVVSITITNGGSAYTTPPTIAITGGGGTGAAAVSVIGTGYISAITITNGGASYTSPPTVVISGGGGTGASATAVLTSGAVTGTTSLVGGSGYTTTPTITLVNVNGDYSIDYRTGMLYLTADLALNVVLAWSGEFYVPCRFVEDRLPADEVFFDIFLRNAQGDEIPRYSAAGAGAIPDILIQETRDYI